MDRGPEEEKDLPRGPELVGGGLGGQVVVWVVVGGPQVGVGLCYLPGVGRAWVGLG